MELSSVISQCMHCQSPTHAGEKFCCSGCESVYSLFQERGLLHYYILRDQQSFAPPRPATLASTPAAAPTVHGTKASFYLEGIHCLGCLWLLEKLPELEPGVASARLRLGDSLLDVTIDDNRTSFQKVAGLLFRLGYVPHLVNREEAREKRAQESRRMLFELAVAGFCAGNIMLLAVSLYAGADGALAAQFRWVSFLLSLPVVFYSSRSLAANTLTCLRTRRISIDLPIFLAVAAAFSVSVWSLLTGGDKYYFDSLTMLVFLLLASRYLLRSLERSVHGAAPFLSYLSNDSYTKDDGTKIDAAGIQPGDRVLVETGAVIPVDGELLSDSASLDSSLLTGESLPQELKKHDPVYSGTRNLGAAFLLRAANAAADSRLARLLQSMQAQEKSPMLLFADKVGTWFVRLVFVAAGAVFVSRLPGDPGEGLERALALIIVTCPCVLAFAIPMTQSLAVRAAAKKGIFVKNAESLERLAAAKKLFLDKTGTLTDGRFEVRSLLCGQEHAEAIRRAVLALESESRHPVAKALLRYCGKGWDGAIPKTAMREETSGVRGEIEGSMWEIRPSESATEKKLEVYRDSGLLGVFSLGDSLRADSAACVEKLREWYPEPEILSGDFQSLVTSMANGAGVKIARGGLSPEAKAELVKKSEGSVMVGDGANDALSLKAASVGIAVQGSLALALESADIYLSKAGLAGLIDLVKIAKASQKLVVRNFIITFFYNLLAGALAAAGFMAPLWAAVLMPLSALSVFLYTLKHARAWS